MKLEANISTIFSTLLFEVAPPDFLDGRPFADREPDERVVEIYVDCVNEFHRAFSIGRFVKRFSTVISSALLFTYAGKSSLVPLTS